MVLGLFLVQATFNGDDILFLPFLNFSCLNANGFIADENTITLSAYEDLYEDDRFRNYTLITLDPITGNPADDGAVQTEPGECFIKEAVCK